MASFFDKARIQTASHKMQHFPLSSRHTTTTDFFQFNIPYIHRLTPGTSLKVDVSTFARLAGMPLPTFGDANLNLRAFFVPYRLVFKGFDDFITNAVHVNSNAAAASIPTYVPYFTNQSFVEALTSSEYVSSVDPATTPYDISVNNYVLPDRPQDLVYYKFSRTGRLLFKIFRQLGYSPNFDVMDDVTTYGTGGTRHSALDIMCWVKVFLDYYFPSQYMNLQDRTYLEAILKFDGASPKELSANDLKVIFRMCILVYYASDFFTAAFDSPNGPNDGNTTRISPIKDVSVSDDSPSSRVINGSSNANYNHNSTPTLAGFNTSGGLGSISPYNLSEYALMALRKLTDYMKRHQLAGSRAIDRFFARFGITLDSNAVDRCYYLGSHHVPLVVADVMSTADTTNAAQTEGVALGDYAGKGFLTGRDGHFEYESKDYGLFMICSSLIPNIGYYQGYDLQTRYITALDFYTPEFDGLGTRVLRRGELWAPMDPAAFSSACKTENAFGFTPQYAEYKIARDRLTGDFNYPSVNAAGFTSNSWHLFRELDEAQLPDSDYNQLVHNYSFVRANDLFQYDRIFYDVGSEAPDHFVVNYLFKIDLYAPYKPLFDTYNFEHDDGREVDINVNGKRVN